MSHDYTDLIARLRSHVSFTGSREDRALYVEAADAIAAQATRITELEDRLFALGAMCEAPCFCCGYNGRGYYQPSSHPCAARHHLARQDHDE